MHAAGRSRGRARGSDMLARLVGHELIETCQEVPGLDASRARDA